MTSGTYHTKDLTNFRLLHLLPAIIRATARNLLRLRTYYLAGIEAHLWLPHFAVRAPAIVGAIPSIPPMTRRDPGTPMKTLVQWRPEPSWIEAGTGLAETETTTTTEAEKKPGTRTETDPEGVGL